MHISLTVPRLHEIWSGIYAKTDAIFAVCFLRPISDGKESSAPRPLNNGVYRRLVFAASHNHLPRESAYAELNTSESRDWSQQIETGFSSVNNFGGVQPRKRALSYIVAGR